MKWLRQILTAQVKELRSKCTCDEFIKTGPGVRVPQQRLWSENNELLWKKSPQYFCERQSAAPVICLSLTIKWIKLSALKQPSPEFPTFLLKKKKKRKPKQHYPLLAHSLICSRSHFLMLHEALHSCATGERFSVAEKWDFPPKGRYNSKGTIKLLYMSDIKK